MHPSEYCKQIGLKSLQHLADISKQPIATLQRWWVRKNHQFKIMAAGSLVTEKSSHKDPSMVRGMTLVKTDEWIEADGDCVFIRFCGPGGPPEMEVCTPDEFVHFESPYTHFIKGFDFQYLYDEAQRLNKGRK